RLLNNMKQISETVLKYYPNNVESLSNISVVYLLNGEYDKGLAPLLKAEKINPKDYIVLGNIAQTYKLKGNKKMSIKYYEKMLKYGDGQTKEFAKEQIANLKK
ncbi:MAG TPA: tetratricopeptide repeat protein, partial [Flavobacteriia bacterium]|nr:tetratricopeptide repeat protein [Flavobacteriia bacterium]